jgi:hypothetical protein
MIEQIARFPRVRGHAIFVVDDDIVPDAFGPELPLGLDPVPVRNRSSRP